MGEPLDIIAALGVLAVGLASATPFLLRRRQRFLAFLTGTLSLAYAIDAVLCGLEALFASPPVWSALSFVVFYPLVWCAVALGWAGTWLVRGWNGRIDPESPTHDAG